MDQMDAHHVAVWRRNHKHKGVVKEEEEEEDDDDDDQARARMYVPV
jgi:hypothetical protein